eukprot:11366098-Alexandrium_andersonii.AAC.1
MAAPIARVQPATRAGRAAHAEPPAGAPEAPAQRKPRRDAAARTWHVQPGGGVASAAGGAPG